MANDKNLSSRVKGRGTGEESNSNPEPRENNWPRFVVISPSNGNQSLAKLSPFAVAKGIKGCAGDPKDVKILQSGLILVECLKRQQSDNLLKCQMFVNIPVKVTPHQTLNYCKGVVRSHELRNCSEADMLDNLRDQGVVEVKRIHITRRGQKILTNTFVLKFDVSSVPSSIKAGFVNVPVKPFVPNPLRCYNCQRFGHHRNKCRKLQVCARCGQEGHDFSSCGNPEQCANCKGDHSASSKECAKWKQERDIQSIKVLDKVSFQEAKKRVLARGVPDVQPAQTFADIVRSPRVRTTSVGVQTEITWLHRAECSKLDGSGVNSGKSRSDASTETSSDLNTSPKGVVKKPVPKQKQAKEGKPPKIQRDPIQLYNRYGALGEGVEPEVSSQKTKLPPKGKQTKSPAKKAVEPKKPNREEVVPGQVSSGSKPQAGKPVKPANKKCTNLPIKSKGETKPTKGPKITRIEVSSDTPCDPPGRKSGNRSDHRSRSHSPIHPPP